MQQKKLNLTIAQLNSEILSLVETKNETGSFIENDRPFDTDLYLIIEQKQYDNFDEAVDEAVEYRCDRDDIDMDNLTEDELTLMYKEEREHYISEMFFHANSDITKITSIDSIADAENLIDEMKSHENNDEFYNFTTNFISSNDKDLQTDIFEIEYNKNDEEFEITDNSVRFMKDHYYGGRIFTVNTYIKISNEYLVSITKDWEAINKQARLEREEA